MPSNEAMPYSVSSFARTDDTLKFLDPKPNTPSPSNPTTRKPDTVTPRIRWVYSPVLKSTSPGTTQMPIVSPGALHLPFPSRGGRRVTRPTARSVSRFVWMATLSW